MRYVLALAFALLSTAAGAQTGTTVKQSGTTTPGHPAQWLGNGIISDGGTAALGTLTGVGVVASGPGVCQSNTTAISGPYNQLCLNVTATGGGFTLNNYNGATGGFTITINGVSQGLVTINLPTVLNNPACFSNTTGTMQNCSVTGSGNAVLATAPTISSLTVTTAFTATGLVTNADLANPSATINGTVCTLGGSCTVVTASASITVGTTTIVSGTPGNIEYNNGGVLGEKAVTGSGSVVLATSPSIASLTVTGAFTATGLVTLADHATQAANTVLGNFTSGVASPTAQVVSSCSAASNALIWTTNTGFGCNSAITAAVAPASGLTGQVAVANGGTGLGTLTSNVIYKGNGTGNIATSALTDNGTIVTSSESIDAQTNAFLIEIPNAAGGTTINLIAKLTGAPSTAVTTLTSDTNTAVGIVVGGAGTTGSAQIAHAGQASCVFDGATVAGDYVSISPTVAGDCHDAGATYPTSGQILGRVLSTNGGGGTYAMLVFPAEFDGSAGGGGGFTSAQIIAGSAISISGSCNSSSSISCTITNNGVRSVNSLSGTLTIAAGGGATVSNAGSTITVSAVLTNYISGLILSNDGASGNTVLDIASGSAADTTNAVNISIGAFTKSTGGPWSSGSGSNGMGNGLTIAATTWYHVCLANNSGTADVWFDTSATCSNRPAGISDTKYRRIGSFRTDGGANILAFVQFGNEFLWATTVIDVNVSNLSTSAVLYTLTVPTGVQVRARIRSNSSNASNGSVLITSPDENDQASSFTAAGATNSNANTASAFGSQNTFDVRTDTSARVRARASASSTTFRINTYGWYDLRGGNG